MILKAEGLMKDYPRLGGGANHFQAVQSCDMTLTPGSVTMLTGRSGSGKTTLLQLLCGLLSPTEGRVLADDTELYTLDDAKLSRFRNAHFGIIPQGHSAVSSLTVLENVLLPATMYGTKADAAAAEQLLERFGIAKLRNELPRSLSGG